jgi:hypothetical protein
VAVRKNNHLLFKEAALPLHNDQNRLKETDANEAF